MVSENQAISLHLTIIRPTPALAEKQNPFRPNKAVDRRVPSEYDRDWPDFGLSRVAQR